MKTKTKKQSFHFAYPNEQVPLKEFLDWIERTVPKNAINPTIGLDEYWEYDTLANIFIEVKWKEEK